MKILHVTETFDRDTGVSLVCGELCNRHLPHQTCAIAYNKADGYPIAPAAHVTHFYQCPWHSFEPDFVHIHTIWSPYYLKTMAYCLWHKIPYGITLHGSMMPWRMAIRPRQKRLFLRAGLRYLINHARWIHVTSQEEAAQAKIWGITAPYLMAPLATDLPEIPPPQPHAQPKTILFVSRVSAEKDLPTLLTAWHKCQRTDARLKIVGPDWNNHLTTLQEQIKHEQIERVTFCGPLYGQALHDAYQLADLFVLPSPSENFSAVILQALSYGLPIIATQGTPWQILETDHLGSWLPSHDPDLLAAAINHWLDIDHPTRLSIFERARNLVKTTYSWHTLIETFDSGGYAAGM